MADLFDTTPDEPGKDAGAEEPAPKRPLAEQLRPTHLSEVVGQGHILGPEGSLTRMIGTGAIPSLIFWGPPGVGKTTIARLLAQETDLTFVQISAIFTGVQDLRKTFDAAALRHANGA
ncbi:MAG: AAA family ATPase, partial [Pseudomonadota bacterium]